MSLLSRLEAALELIAEGGAERVFGGRLDLVAVGQELYNAAVERAVDGSEGPLAPNAFRAELALVDYGHFRHEVEALQARYAMSLWARLREAGYALASPPGVLVTPNERVAEGVAQVAAAFVATAPRFTLSNPATVETVCRLSAPTTLGRSSDCDLCLARASVSRRHAQIIWDRADFVLVDLGSSNGTQLNGVEVSRAVLQTADRLTLGDVVLEFAPEIVPLSIGVGAVVA
jgi:hypothetical protein